MLKAIRAIAVGLSSKLFGENISLEHKIFICVAVSGILLAGIGIVGNVSLGLHHITIIVPAVNIILDTVCVIYSIATKKWKPASVVAILYATFVLIPFLWFSTGGATGSTIPFIILSGMIIVIMFHGRLRVAISVTFICVFSIFIYLEMLYPGIFIPYPSREAHYIDLILGLILCFVITISLTSVVFSSYKNAKLETDELLRQMEYITLIDPLTGVYNRRYLTAHLDEQMRLSYETGAPLALCIIDVDHFKRINDTFGHLFGDQVLIALSQKIESCLGPNEVFGRYGGEEFLIIMKNCRSEAALEIIGRMYRELDGVSWEHDSKVTVSCGISEYRKGMSYSEFVRHADENLYRAKENGRNQVVAG